MNNFFKMKKKSTLPSQSFNGCTLSYLEWPLRDFYQQQILGQGHQVLKAMAIPKTGMTPRLN